MDNYQNNDFVKRVRVKGYPRITPGGKVYMVSPHFRKIKTTRDTKPILLKRNKLI